MSNIKSAITELRSDLIEFARDLVRTKSYSGDEKEIIHLIEKKMKQLDYDEVTLDSMGNLVGRIGNGKKVLMFDSHVDTVAVNNISEWAHDPFAGVIENGRLHGRGSVDMKSSAAASIYAGAIAKRVGFHKDKTIYVSCTVMEEDCDGENLKHLFKECRIKPDCMIICEPSGNKLVTGHKGKAQIAIKTQGISAHGSAPEKGVNAIYEMAQIIQRIEKTSNALLKTKPVNGTLVAIGIPTIGFGPGEYKLAHMTNENCEISQIIDACDFYATVMDKA